MSTGSLILRQQGGLVALSLVDSDGNDKSFYDLLRMDRADAMALSAGTSQLACDFDVSDWKSTDTPMRLVAILSRDLGDGKKPWIIKLVPATTSEEDAKTPDVSGKIMGRLSHGYMEELDRHNALIFTPDTSPLVRFNLQRKIAETRTQLLVLEAQLESMGENTMGKHNYMPA
ncbi:hypothetical protein ACOI1H_16095 [Loktanella sp. DJP18]|uniref:hypothetical protein n=1 Tax=Loktanella sp. DJP18 TaxID=3409788 RepID=UPI003BB6CD46